eukprot:GHVT01005539.1.p1 GENE.GHVT01005539.1~~GHVT01005539.1.p1  ORF type:complete len:596 (-),score=115.94 GHVT01005539.1:1148-2935(-)
MLRSALLPLPTPRRPQAGLLFVGTGVSSALPQLHHVLPLVHAVRDGKITAESLGSSEAGRPAEASAVPSRQHPDGKASPTQGALRRTADAAETSLPKDAAIAGAPTTARGAGDGVGFSSTARGKGFCKTCLLAWKDPGNKNARNNVSLLIRYNTERGLANNNKQQAQALLPEPTTDATGSSAMSNSRTSAAADDASTRPLVEHPPKEGGAATPRFNDIAVKQLLDAQGPRDECSPAFFNVLIDVGKTFRDAALKSLAMHGITRIDCLFLSHDHQDALGGLDDLRDLQYFSRSASGFYAPSCLLPTFVSRAHVETIKAKYSYITDLAAIMPVPNAPELCGKSNTAGLGELKVQLPLPQAPEPSAAAATSSSSGSPTPLAALTSVPPSGPSLCTGPVGEPSIGRPSVPPASEVEASRCPEAGLFTFDSSAFPAVSMETPRKVLRLAICPLALPTPMPSKTRLSLKELHGATASSSASRASVPSTLPSALPVAGAAAATAPSAPQTAPSPRALRSLEEIILPEATPFELSDNAAGADAAGRESAAGTTKLDCPLDERDSKFVDVQLPCKGDYSAFCAPGNHRGLNNNAVSMRTRWTLV